MIYNMGQLTRVYGKEEVPVEFVDIARDIGIFGGPAPFPPWCVGLRVEGCRVYRGTSIMRKSAHLGPCSGIMRRALWWFSGVL